jgi:hypothetical protein
MIKIEIPKKEPVDGVTDITIPEPINKDRSIWFDTRVINIR